MPRKRAARVRAEQPPRKPVEQPSFAARGSEIPGLSARGRKVLAQLESTRFYRGETARALDSYARFVRDPYHRLFDQKYGCGIPECCPDPVELREKLEMVAHALPRRDARVFRRQLAELDELY
jgi:hypothetical protein